MSPLLDEASALLDRALADRLVYGNLGIDYFKTKLEILEFLRLDAIHTEERAAQVYEVPHAEADAALNSEKEMLKGENAASPRYGDLRTLVSNPKLARRIEIAAVSAQNNSIPFYTNPAPPYLRQFPTISSPQQGQDTTANDLAREQRADQLTLECRRRSKNPSLKWPGRPVAPE